MAARIWHGVEVRPRKTDPKHASDERVTGPHQPDHDVDDVPLDDTEK